MADKPESTSASQAPPLSYGATAPSSPPNPSNPPNPIVTQPTAVPSPETQNAQTTMVPQDAQNTTAPPTAYQYPQPGQQVAPAIPSEPPPAYEPPSDPSAFPTAAFPQQPYPAQGQPGYQSGEPYTYPAPSPQQTIVIGPGTTFGPYAKGMECPNCHATVTTSVNYVSGGLTWLSAGILCLFLCWPCACIPFCVDGTKDVIHECPSCNKVLGTYHRL